MNARTMTPLIVWIPGQPVPKGRPRLGNGHVFTPAKTREAEETFKWRLKAAKAKLFDMPVKVEMHFHRSDNRLCDLDNLVKLCWDAMQGVCYQDDSQIVELHAVLERGCSEPGTWLKVSPVL